MRRGIEQDNRTRLDRMHRKAQGPFTAGEAAGFLDLEPPRARRLLAYLAERDGWPTALAVGEPNRYPPAMPAHLRRFNEPGHPQLGGAGAGLAVESRRAGIGSMRLMIGVSSRWIGMGIGPFRRKRLMEIRVPHR